MTDPFRADPLSSDMHAKRFFVGTNGHVLCIDQRSGETIWQTELWKSVGTNLMMLLRHQGRIFAACTRYVGCIDERDGALLWRTKVKKLGEPVSLALDMTEPGGQLLVAGAGQLYGFAAETGTRQWHNSLPGLGFHPISLRVSHATVAQAQPRIISSGKATVTVPIEDAQEEPREPTEVVASEPTDMSDFFEDDEITPARR